MVTASAVRTLIPVIIFIMLAAMLLFTLNQKSVLSLKVGELRSNIRALETQLAVKAAENDAKRMQPVHRPVHDPSLHQRQQGKLRTLPGCCCTIDGAEHIRLLTARDIVEEPVDCVSVGLPEDASKFKMCVHPSTEDSWVSGSLIRDGVWEAPILRRFVETLDKFPDAIVLDVGAQLGMYGIQAAWKNRTVVMVEAMQHNANHILHSFRKNGLLPRLCKDIFVVGNVVASASGRPYGVVFEQGNNNGATSWGPNHPAADFEGARRQTASATLDELLPLLDGWETVVMKMDIEGSECDALRGLDRLLASKRLAAVFMEAGHFAESKGTPRRAPCDLHAQLSRLAAAGLAPRSLEGEKLEVADWEKWPWDLVWTRT